MSGFVFGDIFNSDTETKTISTKEALSQEEDFSFKGVFGVVENKHDRVRVGGIIRTTPFAFHMLSDTSVIALGRNLKELGITEAVPKAQKNRLKMNIEKGFVAKDGGSFTEKGTEIAAQHLVRNGYSLEAAKNKAKTAKAWKHDPNRIEALGQKIEGFKKTDLKFGFGYRLDQKGKTFTEEKVAPTPMRATAPTPSMTFPVPPKPTTAPSGNAPKPSLFSILGSKNKPTA